MRTLVVLCLADLGKELSDMNLENHRRAVWVIVSSPGAAVILKRRAGLGLYIGARLVTIVIYHQAD